MAPPALPPLSSLPPAYVHAYNGDPLRDTAIAFTVLEILFVGLRFWSKKIGHVRFGIDDWLMVIGLVFCLALNSLSFVALKIDGLGSHFVVVAQTSPHKLVIWAKFLVVVPILWAFAVTLPRLAILIFYSRIFTLGWGRIATYVLMAIVVATSIAVIVADAVQCIPWEYMWDRTIKGHCFNIVAYDRYTALPNIITDFVILLLPIPHVWALQTSIRTRIALTITFMAGSIGMIASIIRLITYFGKNQFSDRTWNGTVFFIWIAVEPGCYIIAASLICLRPLFNLLTGQTVDGSAKKKTKSSRFTSLRSLFKSSRGDSAMSIDSPPMPLDEMRNKAFYKPQIKVDRRFELVDDEEALVTQLNHVHHRTEGATFL